MWNRVPSWLRPPLLSALVSLGGIGAPMLIAVLLLPDVRESAEVAEAAYVLAVAIAAGTAGGLAFSLLGRPLLRIPIVGRPMAGTACVLAYLGICMAAFDGWSSMPARWEVILALSIGFGTLLGFFLPDDTGESSRIVVRTAAVGQPVLLTALSLLTTIRAYTAVADQQDTPDSVLGYGIVLGLLIATAAGAWIRYFNTHRALRWAGTAPEQGVAGDVRPGITPE